MYMCIVRPFPSKTHPDSVAPPSDLEGDLGRAGYPYLDGLGGFRRGRRWRSLVCGCRLLLAPEEREFEVVWEEGEKDTLCDVLGDAGVVVDGLDLDDLGLGQLDLDSQDRV